MDGYDAVRIHTMTLSSGYLLRMSMAHPLGIDGVILDWVLYLPSTNSSVIDFITGLPAQWMV